MIVCMQQHGHFKWAFNVCIHIWKYIITFFFIFLRPLWNYWPPFKFLIKFVLKGNPKFTIPLTFIYQMLQLQSDMLCHIHLVLFLHVSIWSNYPFTVSYTSTRIIKAHYVVWKMQQTFNVNKLDMPEICLVTLLIILG